MEVGPLLFVMFLLSIGFLLIVIFRRGLKEQARQQERMASEARYRHSAELRAARRKTQPAAPHAPPSTEAAARKPDAAFKSNP